ncbi:hypothetical protein ABTC12_20035, partial [Acinetobacter baumannii]
CHRQRYGTGGRQRQRGWQHRQGEYHLAEHQLPAGPAVHRDQRGWWRQRAVRFGDLAVGLPDHHPGLYRQHGQPADRR